MGEYETTVALGPEILFQNNGKVIVTEFKDISERRLNLVGILSSLVSVRLLLSPDFFFKKKGNTTNGVH